MMTMVFVTGARAPHATTTFRRTEEDKKTVRQDEVSTALRLSIFTYLHRLSTLHIGLK